MPLSNNSIEKLKQYVNSKLDALNNITSIFPVLLVLNDNTIKLPLNPNKTPGMKLARENYATYEEICTEIKALFTNPLTHLNARQIIGKTPTSDDELRVEIRHIVIRFLIKLHYPYVTYCETSNIAKLEEYSKSKWGKLVFEPNDIEKIFTKEYYKNYLDKPFIVMAAEHNHTDMVIALRAQGAPIYPEALAAAKRNGNKRMLEHLLTQAIKDHTFRLDTKLDDLTICQYVIAHSSDKILQMLLQSERLTPEVINSNCLLHHAIKAGKENLISKLIEKGADINAQGQGTPFDGRSPIHYALTTNNLHAAYLLSQRNARLDILSNTGASALHSAAARGNTYWLEQMALKKPDMLLHTNSSKATPLDILSDKLSLDEIIDTVIKILVDLAREEELAILNQVFEQLITKKYYNQLLSALAQITDSYLIKVFSIANFYATSKSSENIEQVIKNLESCFIVKLIENHSTALTTPDRNGITALDAILDESKRNPNSRRLKGFIEFLILTAVKAGDKAILKAILDGCLLREITLDAEDKSFKEALLTSASLAAAEDSINYLLKRAINNEEAGKDFVTKKIAALLASAVPNISELIEILTTKTLMFKTQPQVVSEDDITKCKEHFKKLANETTPPGALIVFMLSILPYTKGKGENSSMSPERTFFKNIFSEWALLLIDKLATEILNYPYPKMIEEYFEIIDDHKNIIEKISGMNLPEEAHLLQITIQAKFPAILASNPDAMAYFMTRLSEKYQSTDIQFSKGESMLAFANEIIEKNVLATYTLDPNKDLMTNISHIDKLVAILKRNEIEPADKKSRPLSRAGRETIIKNLAVQLPSIFTLSLESDEKQTFPSFEEVIARLNNFTRYFIDVKSDANLLNLIKTITIKTYLLAARREGADLASLVAILASGQIVLNNKQLVLAINDADKAELTKCLGECLNNIFGYSAEVLSKAAEGLKALGQPYQALAKEYAEKALVRNTSQKQPHAAELATTELLIRFEAARTDEERKAPFNELAKLAKQGTLVAKRAVADIYFANNAPEKTWFRSQSDIARSHYKELVEKNKHTYSEFRLKQIKNTKIQDDDQKYEKVKETMNLAFKLACSNDNYEKIAAKQYLADLSRTRSTLPSEHKIYWYAKALLAILNGQEEMVVCAEEWSSLYSGVRPEHPVITECGVAMDMARGHFYCNPHDLDNCNITDVMRVFINQDNRPRIGSDEAKASWKKIIQKHAPISDTANILHKLDHQQPSAPAMQAVDTQVEQAEKRVDKFQELHSAVQGWEAEGLVVARAQPTAPPIQTSNPRQDLFNMDGSIITNNLYSMWGSSAPTASNDQPTQILAPTDVEQFNGKEEEEEMQQQPEKQQARKRTAVPG